MIEAYSSCGLTRAWHARSFVWIQLVFRFLLIIAKVVFTLALQYVLSSLDLIAKLLLDICSGQLWLEVY